MQIFDVLSTYLHLVHNPLAILPPYMPACHSPTILAASIAMIQSSSDLMCILDKSLKVSDRNQISAVRSSGVVASRIYIVLGTSVDFSLESIGSMQC